MLKHIFEKLGYYWDFAIAFILIECNLKKSIRVKHIKEPIRLRRKTSDIMVFRQVFTDQEYEMSVHLPDSFDPKVIIDGGGNIGLASVFFKNKYKNAKIISIEPNKANFDILQQNIKNYPEVIGVNSALWDKSTYLKIKNINSSNWGFVVHETTQSDENSFMAMSISDLMRQFQLEKIDLLKIDIEGAEKEVFSASNCDEWLGKTHVLVIEVHDFIRAGTAKAVFDAVHKYNYNFRNLGENLIFIFDHPKD